MTVDELGKVWISNLTKTKCGLLPLFWIFLGSHPRTRQTERALKFVNVFNPFRAGVYFKRQNLASKVDPRTERVKYFIMAITQVFKEAERAN